MQPSLLHTIYALGDRMCAALESNDLDAFFGLLEERTVLIDQLATFDHPSEVDSNWADLAPALNQQQHRINRALGAQEQQVSEAIGAHYRFRNARQRYHERPAHSRFLNKNLHG